MSHPSPKEKVTVKARPTFLLKILCYTGALTACAWLFTGRTDNLLRSEKNKNDLPTTLNSSFPERINLIHEFTSRPRNPEDPTELRSLERFILEKVPWQSDWRNWGTREYIPSPRETALRGTEDCDGRAILFTNLARFLGHKDVHIIWSETHVWTADGDKNQYLLYAPPDFAEKQEEEKVTEVYFDPAMQGNPEDEFKQTGDAPPTQTLVRPIGEQLQRDLASMSRGRIYKYTGTAIFLALLGAFLPKDFKRKKEKN